MRNFILGVIVAVVAIFAGVYIYLNFGFFNVSALPGPGAAEKWMANRSLDPSVDRRAPKGPNPVPMNDAVLIDAAKEYEEHCSMCHGSQNKDALDFGDALSPRAPNLIRRPRHDPDGNVYWVIENGIRMTGMPGWQKHLKPDEMWGMVHLLKNVDKLSPAVLTAWQQAATKREDVMPQTGQQAEPNQPNPAPMHQQ